MKTERHVTNVKWRTVLLGELMPGRGESVDPSNYPDETFDLYSIPAFDNDKPEVVPGSRIGSTKQAVKSGDVLLSKIVPHIRRAWVVGDSRDRRMIGSSEWIVFRNSGVFPGYLRHLLVEDRFHRLFMQTVSGVGGSLLRARPAHVAKIEIPLPPLAEQRRIAEVLDRADALRAKRRAALAQLDVLTQSIFIDLFGNPVTNPKGWDVRPIGECVIAVTNGLTRRRKDSDDGADIVLRLRDIRSGWIDFSDVNRITLSAEESRRYRVEEGDLLFIRVNGNPDYVGRCAAFGGFFEPVYFNDHIMRIKVDRSLITEIFLAFILNSAYGKRQVALHRKTSAGQHTINQEGLCKINIPLPPLPLQQDFARRVGCIENLGKSYRVSLATLATLFAALQHRAFNGEMFNEKNCESLVA